MTEQIQTQKPNAGAGPAMLFFKELMENVETLTGIADQHGARTLADVMYLQNAILDGTFIELYPDESAVLKIIDEMPSSTTWRLFIQVTEEEEQFNRSDSSLLQAARKLVKDIEPSAGDSIALRTDTPNEILEMLLFHGEPISRSREELESRFATVAHVPYVARWMGEPNTGETLQTALAIGQQRWHLNYREYVLIIGCRSDEHGTWWQYRHPDGAKGECFAQLLAVRSDAARVLGFESDQLMQLHAKWLVRSGSQLYLDWASKLVPCNSMALVD